MVLFFTHIPSVVNHTFNATPTERLQQWVSFYQCMVLWYLWTITWILLNELEIGNCKLNVIWLYVLKLYAQIVANREVCAMRTILMHYRNHVDCQRKELTLMVPQDAVRESGLCHTLLKHLNAHKTDQCWNVCNAILCFCRIVNIYRMCSRKWQS